MEEDEGYVEEEANASPEATSSTPKKRRGRPPKVKTMLLTQQQQGEGATKQIRKKRKWATDKQGKMGRKKRVNSGAAGALSDGGGPAVNSSNIGDMKQEARVLVGQPVKGVVDGSFDAGYLVSIRVGDSETVYRGVVFGPGLSLPLTKDNDVAPKVKISSREEAPPAPAPAPAPAPSPAPSPAPTHAPALAPAPAPPPPPPPPPPAPPVAAPPTSHLSPPPHINDSASMYHQQHHHHISQQMQEVSRPGAMPPAPGLGFGSPPHPSMMSPPPRSHPSAHGGHGYGGAVAFRSPPNYGQNSSAGASPGGAGGFMYPPSMPPPTANPPNHGFYSPRGFAYPFHVSRPDYSAGYHPQFGGGPPADAHSQAPPPAAAASAAGAAVPPHAS